MGLSTVTYALAKNYTDETAAQFGGLKGAPCKVKSIVKQNGQSVITFEQKNDEGETRESYAYVNDGTPIYEWTSGDTYKYGDLAIYASCFYRCIRENSDVVFDDTKWNEIGSPDGNYDIVQTAQDLPPRFTSADRKMYYSIADGYFWLWDGTQQVAQNQGAGMELTQAQYDALPTAQKLNGTEYFITDGVAVVAELNDNTTAVDKVWSSSKVSTELGNKTSKTYVDDQIVAAKAYTDQQINTAITQVLDTYF